METRITHHHSWEFRRKKIGDRILEEGVENFLQWPTVVGSMYTGITEEVDAALKILDQWQRKIDIPEQSGTMILQALGLYVYEEMSGEWLPDKRSIVEFGGGYGAMAKLLYGLGFKGEYEIVDFPEIAMIQAYYLDGVPVKLSESVTISNPDAFIGFNSLGEAPYPDRNRALSCKPKEVFALYVPRYDSNDASGVYDNVSYFDNLKDRGYTVSTITSPVSKSHMYTYAKRV